MKRKLISFDWAIKKLLRSKANFGILAGFLSELLFTDITIVEILESETNKQSSVNKQSRVDIKVRDADGQLILIEVQYSREQDYLFRILFETSKCITEHLDEGCSYSDVVKVISVSILYFDFCKGDDYIYYGTTRFIGLHNKAELQLNQAQRKLFNIDKVADIFPEHYIINIKNFNDVATAPLDEWIYFLKNEEIKDDFHAKGLIEAKEKLDVLKLDASDKADYENYQKELHHQASSYESTYILGRVEGKEEGKAEGKAEGIESVAMSMLNAGMADEQIAVLTKLNIGEVALLRAKFTAEK
ncbi:MAG: Rpn family recombination-promoting nuclease/putative transposase [Algicola sp.]|nr:Rpn family recombination-promoting nuclease/putative transposase [Algicola sp.]